MFTPSSSSRQTAASFYDYDIEMIVRSSFLLPQTYSYHLVPRDGDEELSEENKLGTVRDAACLPLKRAVVQSPNVAKPQLHDSTPLPPPTLTPVHTHNPTSAPYQINFVWNTYQIRSPMSNGPTGIVLCSRFPDALLSMDGKRYRVSVQVSQKYGLLSVCDESNKSFLQLR